MATEGLQRQHCLPDATGARADVAGDAQPRLEVVGRGRGLARCQLRGGQLEHESSALARGRRLGERAPQAGHRRGGGAARERAERRLAQRGHHLAIARGLGRQQMDGDRIDRGALVSQQRRGSPVSAAARARVQVGVDRRAQDGVREGQRTLGREDVRFDERRSEPVRALDR